MAILKGFPRSDQISIPSVASLLAAARQPAQEAKSVADILAEAQAKRQEHMKKKWSVADMLAAARGIKPVEKVEPVKVEPVDPRYVNHHPVSAVYFSIVDDGVVPPEHMGPTLRLFLAQEYDRDPSILSRLKTYLDQYREHKKEEEKNESSGTN